MKGDSDFPSRIVHPVADFRVILIDGKAGGKEDGEGENEALPQ